MPDVWAGLGGLSGQTAAQEARRNGAAAREKRYADCVLEVRCAKSDFAQFTEEAFGSLSSSSLYALKYYFRVGCNGATLVNCDT